MFVKNGVQILNHTNDYRKGGIENNQRKKQAYRTGFLHGYNEAYNRYRRSNRGNRNRRGY